MYPIETVESLRSYADRLRRERVQLSAAHAARPAPVRQFVRRVRRSG